MSDEVWRLLTLFDYNTRVVFFGTTILGITAGVVGALMQFRKQSLAGDIVSHAALPGIALAYLIGEALEPGSGRSLWRLLLGATISGIAGLALASFVSRYSRIKDDAALALVLGLFFGAGVVLLSAIQVIPGGNAAGLGDLIFGTAASMSVADVWVVGGLGLIILLIVLAVLKELVVVAFDVEFSRAQGFPVGQLDLLLSLLVTLTTVAGLQSVGLLLVVALLIIPAAAARFWTNNVSQLLILAVCIGGCSCGLGVLISALLPKLATGAVIVLTGTVMFGVSLLCGTQRGLWPEWQAQRRLKQRIGEDDLLRACFEAVETKEGLQQTWQDITQAQLPVDQIGQFRRWTLAELNQRIASARRKGLLRYDSEGNLRFTKTGASSARQAVRNHRLWEWFLIEHADIAPELVDRTADRIEHVIDPTMIDELSHLLQRHGRSIVLPESPHPLQEKLPPDPSHEVKV